MDIENAFFHQDIKSGKEFPVKLRMKRLFSDCSAFQLIFISQSETVLSHRSICFIFLPCSIGYWEENVAKLWRELMENWSLYT